MHEKVLFPQLYVMEKNTLNTIPSTDFLQYFVQQLYFNKFARKTCCLTGTRNFPPHRWPYILSCSLNRPTCCAHARIRHMAIYFPRYSIASTMTTRFVVKMKLLWKYNVHVSKVKSSPDLAGGPQVTFCCFFFCFFSFMPIIPVEGPKLRSCKLQSWVSDCRFCAPGNDVYLLS